MQVPKELTVKEILEIEDQFVAAAKRAVTAGCQALEIHAAHGYLIHQFCSPHTNHRTDQYGGSFENRSRFLFEVSQSVRAAVPSTLLFVRLTGFDAVPGGWTMEEAVKASRILRDLGVDLIDISSGSVVPMADRMVTSGPGYQIEDAARVRKEAAIPTGAVGKIDSVEMAEWVIAEGKADLVFQARETLRNPYFPFHAAQVLGVKDFLRTPVQYERRINKL